MSALLTFKPIRREILSITNAERAVITTTEPHGYLPGLYVRINLPDVFGMEPLNGQQFLIDDITPTTFSIPINTLKFGPFVTGVANILNITNSNPAIVTVSSPQFLPNLSIIVTGLTDPGLPLSTMLYLNGNAFRILTVIAGISVHLPVDTTGLGPYVSGGRLVPIQSPQVIPIAEIAGTLQNAEKNNLTPIGGP